jgi:hypothetical protein
VTVVDEYKSDNVGHDNEREEAAVHGKDGMSKLPERLVIDPLCRKRVRNEERLRFFFFEWHDLGWQRNSTGPIALEALFW